MNTRTIKISDKVTHIYMSHTTEAYINELALDVFIQVKKYKDVEIEGLLYQSHNGFIFKRKRDGFEIFELNHKSFKFIQCENIFNLKI